MLKTLSGRLVQYLMVGMSYLPWKRRLWIVSTHLERPSGVPWNMVRRKTGTSAACQSWQWITSGVQPRKFRAASAALEK